MTRIPIDVRQQMRDDREGGMTLTQLMTKYGKSRSTVSFTIKGCDDSKVMWAAPGKKIVKEVKSKSRPELSTTDIGEAARQMICARLMLNGVKVFRPMTEDTPVDLLILKENGDIARCQCKYMFPSLRGTHVLSCHSNVRGKNRGIGKHVYTEKEVDYFLGYCLDNDGVYIVPRSVTGGRHDCHFWILRSPSGGNVGERIDEKQYKEAFDLLK